MAVLLANAFFGHELYGSPYEQDINRYSVYVHLGEGWDSRPGNILFEVTNVWSNPDPGQGHSADPSDVSELAVYNPNRLEYQRGLPYVELRHEFSDCGSSWQPMAYRLAVDSVRAWIESVQGARLNSDPYVRQLPDVPGPGSAAPRSYAQFIPVCASSDPTSYEYSVSISGAGQFDVFFVDSEDRLGEYLETGSVGHYEGCGAEGMSSFGGSCSGVAAGSGLLVLVPDDVDSSLARVTISMREA